LNKTDQWRLATSFVTLTTPAKPTHQEKFAQLK